MKTRSSKNNGNTPADKDPEGAAVEGSPDFRTPETAQNVAIQDQVLEASPASNQPIAFDINQQTTSTPGTIAEIRYLIDMMAVFNDQMVEMKQEMREIKSRTSGPAHHDSLDDSKTTTARTNTTASVPVTVKKEPGCSDSTPDFVFDKYGQHRGDEGLPRYSETPVLSQLPGKPTLISSTLAECTAVLREVSLHSVYNFFSTIKEYEHAHGVRLNHVRMVETSTLEYLAQQADVSVQYQNWSNAELCTALRSVLRMAPATPYRVCELAQKAVKFPRVQVIFQANDLEKAVSQLQAIPHYLSRIEKFRQFVSDFTDIVWPSEKDPKDTRKHRLHEVVEAVITEHAPMAMNVLQSDFSRTRRWEMPARSDEITRVAKGYSSVLSSSYGAFEKISRPTTPLASAPQRSTAAAFKPRLSSGLHNLHQSECEEVDNVEEQEDEEIVTDDVYTSDTDQVPRPPHRELTTDLDVCALYAPNPTAQHGTLKSGSKGTDVDPKTLACTYEMIRGPGTCKHGKDCIFSHDKEVLREVMQKAMLKLN